MNKLKLALSKLRAYTKPLSPAQGYFFDPSLQLHNSLAD